MSKNKSLDLAQWAVDQASKAGAQGSRVSVDNQRYVSMDYRDGKVEKIEEATTNGTSNRPVARAIQQRKTWTELRTVLTVVVITPTQREGKDLGEIVVNLGKEPGHFVSIVKHRISL